MALRPGPLRDAVVLLAVFAVLLGGLYLYTGTWPPAVIVESGSMMHPDADVTYGRSWITFGPATIDPGDLVLVKAVDSPDDVETLVEGGTTHYGKPGDVIVYYKANRRDTTPIIHRAVAYVEVDTSGTEVQYRVRWDEARPCEGGATKEGRWCVYGADGVYIPSVPVEAPGSTDKDPRPFKPIRSGFFTKGDNPRTNAQTDQYTGLSRDANGRDSPVPLEWIEGKGRAEVPWLGLIKLALSGAPNQDDPPREWVRIGSAYAPKDLWVMLGFSLFLLVGVPLAYDGWKLYRDRWQARSGEEDAPDGAAPAAEPAVPPPPPDPAPEALGAAPEPAVREEPERASHERL